MAVRATPWTPGGADAFGGDGGSEPLVAGGIVPVFVAAQRLVGDRYRVERLLGRGGMATVWGGHDLRLDRPVAIKELSGEALRQPRALERFGREARAVGRLSHPNVVSVYDVGTHDGQPYLVMELVAGQTVETLLDDGPLPVAEALAIASQVCDGLAAAHAAGITHRDIKPANLIVTPSGAVKICDFGVARLLDRSGDANLTGPALAWGSPNYMAPEQINAGPIDRRTDLYALGCTLYAMLTGAPPFDGDATLGVLHQHLTTQPESLRLRRVEAPSQVEELVRDLLAKSPGERPPDALAVRDRIAAARADLAPAGTRAVPARSASGSAGATRRHNRRIVAAFAAACLALAAAIVVPILLTKSDPVAGSGTALTSAATSPAAALNPPTSIPSSSGSPSALSSSTRTRAAHSATPSRPPVRIDPVTALRQAISAQVTAGNLDAGAAPGLNHMVDDLANAIDTGNTGDVTNKIKALRAKLANLYKGHQLNDVGYRALNAAVDQVAADQPQPSSTPKPSPPPPPSPRP